MDVRLETERLLLRVPEIGDFDRYAETLADADAARYIGGQLTRAAAWRRFLQMPGAWSVQGFGMFAIVEKASGRWLGQTGPWKPVGWPGNEVGWSFHPDAWGHGYATEAATAAIDWAFDNLGWDRVIHCIHPDNASSQKLAARLGSRNSGPAPLPEPYQDSPNEVWTQTIKEWRARRAAATDAAATPA
ncbi:MAG TPA: GNAT family N-acetyltransferase [Luteimonas sp.]|nr:GNAT family N-acetyltransferase [Luteimonas sp.]